MTESQITSNMKIKGTILDRSKKSSPQAIKYARDLRAKDYTYVEIADMLGISKAAARVWCMDDEQLEAYRKAQRERKAVWYANLPQDKKSKMKKNWDESTKSYKMDLFFTMLDNRRF